MTNEDISYNIKFRFKIKKRKNFLSDLDEKIGDSDFGINIKCAFDSIINNINKDMKINEIFNVIGKDLMAKHEGTLLGMDLQNIPEMI